VKIEISENRANCDSCGFSRYSNGTQTLPVGSFDANQFGLYDTIGNVYEWCSDGRVWQSSNKMKVVRGSSSNSRHGLTTNIRLNNLGFRVVRSINNIQSQLNINATAGNSNQITVRVEPNCEGGSDTKWEFEVSCPMIV